MILPISNLKIDNSIINSERGKDENIINKFK